jgi:hypothetical protein
LVFLELLDLVSDLGSSGLEEVLECVISSLDVDDCVLDLELEVGDFGIVLVSADVELMLEFLKLVRDVLDEVLYKLHELVNGSLRLRVECQHLDDGLAPLGLVQFLKRVLLMAQSHTFMHAHAIRCEHQKH